jgi:hypothetical protein
MELQSKGNNDCAFVPINETDLNRDRIWHDLPVSTEDLNLRNVEDVQVETRALTEAQNEECQDIIRQLRGLKPMKVAIRNKAADYLEELVVWADRSVTLSAERTQIVHSHHTLDALNETISNQLRFTNKQLEDANAQKVRFKRDAASVDSRLILEWVIEEACTEHATLCPTVISI